ncbi:hypothetical protein W02_00940 [Nitrospira sp. KM1]|uniref:Slp family lipoprotein n=1 Tax=Nitrospira sp. KM1 TaxID=1936990 RepID=UPI0013A7795D|nr:Slp family lipoprotein [Nitrospira sp. KM1]BCA52954.1 hypothetical protein W02_00940 [Nitrospira sp. KM1]
MRTHVFQSVSILITAAMLTACAQSAHQLERKGIGSEGLMEGSPASESRVDADASEQASLFAQLRAAPTEFLGRTVTISGIVLNAKRLEGFTELEILQLPADAGVPSAGDRRRSLGRFLARQSSFLDPATLGGDPLVTVTGVVEGELQRPLNEGADNYLYPIVTVRELKVWPRGLSRSSAPFSAQRYPRPYQDLYAEPEPSSFGWLGSFLQGLVQSLSFGGYGGGYGGYGGYNGYGGYRGYRDYYYHGGPYGFSPLPAPPASPPPSPPADAPPQFQKPH